MVCFWAKSKSHNPHGNGTNHSPSCFFSPLKNGWWAAGWRRGLKVGHPGAGTDSVLFFYPLFNLATQFVSPQKLLTHLVVSNKCTGWILSIHPFIHPFPHSTNSWVVLYSRHCSGHGIRDRAKDHRGFGERWSNSLEEGTGSLVLGPEDGEGVTVGEGLACLLCGLIVSYSLLILDKSTCLSGSHFLSKNVLNFSMF